MPRHATVVRSSCHSGLGWMQEKKNKRMGQIYYHNCTRILHQIAPKKSWHTCLSTHLLCVLDNFCIWLDKEEWLWGKGGCLDAKGMAWDVISHYKKCTKEVVKRSTSNLSLVSDNEDPVWSGLTIHPYRPYDINVHQMSARDLKKPGAGLQ